MFCSAKQKRRKQSWAKTRELSKETMKKEKSEKRNISLLDQREGTKINIATWNEHKATRSSSRPKEQVKKMSGQKMERFSPE